MYTESVKKNNFAEAVRAVLSSNYFPFFTAVMFIANYYLGFDIINIYVYAAVIIAMLLLLDDLTPLFSQFLFACVLPSEVNSPTYGTSDYYSRQIILFQIIVLTIIGVSCAIYRIILSVQQRRYSFNLTSVSLLLLGVALCLGGALSSEYEGRDTAYSLGVMASLVPLYFVMSCNIRVNRQNIKKICWAFFIFSITLCVFLGVQFYRAWTDGAIPSGFLGSVRGKYLKFGFGMWNNLGLLLVICIPAVCCLAARSKVSGLFLLWAVALSIAVIESSSRQSYIGLAVALPVSYILTLVKSPNKKQNLILTGAMVVLAILFLATLGRDLIPKIYNFLVNNMFNGTNSGNGRLKLWMNAWDNFVANPVFGVGFYAQNMDGTYSSSISMGPRMYHDTIMQMMGACGSVGIVVYLFHRVCTIIGCFKGRSLEKAYLGILFGVYLLVSLFDNHLFYILSAFFYSALLPYAVNPAAKEEPTLLKKHKRGKDVIEEGINLG